MTPDSAPLPSELTVLAVRNAQVLAKKAMPFAEAPDEARRLLADVYADGVLRRESGVYLLLDARMEVACFDEGGAMRDVWREIPRPLTLGDLAALIAHPGYPGGVDASTVVTGA